MKTLHQNLEQRFLWYKNWHENKNHSVMHYILLVVAILLTAAVVFSSDAVKAAATTYYVSPTGNDNNPGTQTAPWKTLVKGCNTVTNAGDTIYMTAGTYIEAGQCFLAKGVNIEGAGRDTTIIKTTLTSSYTAFIEMVSPDQTLGNQSISGVTFDGQYVSSTNHKTWLAIWVTGRSNVKIHDTKIQNFYWRGVIFNGINADNPGTDVGYNHATGNEFYNNIVTNSADYGISGGGSGALNIGFQNGMLIYGNTIQQNERPDGLNGWPIKYWNQGWLKGVKIYNNTLVKKPYAGTYPGDGNWDFAIELFNVMGGLEIYNNNIQNGSIDLNYNYKESYPYSAWIHDNIISNPVFNAKVEGAIILEWRAEHVIIEDNVINNKAYGVTFNTRTPTARGDDRNNHPGGNTPGGYSYILNAVIRNNLFNNMYSGQGIGNSFAVGVISEGTDDPQINGFDVYNNTIVGKPGNGGRVGIDFSSMSANAASGVDINIRNNIVTGFSDYWYLGSNPAHINGMVMTHNDIIGNGNGNQAGNLPTTNYVNNNNLAVTPGFVSSTDFRLATNSPLIDKGFSPLVLPAISVVLPVPFNGVAPDMGYIETGSSTADTTPPTIVSSNPAQNATGIATTISPTINFSEALSAGTVTSASAYIMQAGTAVPASVTYSNNSIILAPTASLSANTSYTVTVTTAIKDLAGNALAANYNFLFTTAPLANVPPTVSAGVDQTITLPTTSATMAGTATDSDGTIATRTWSKVSGPTAFTITSPTSLTTTITGLTMGTYVFRLTVVDNAGASVSDDMSVIVRDTTAPTVSITAPAAGTVSASIAVSASASDNVAVDHVDFHVDGNYTTTIGTDATSPHSITWNTTTVPNGAHTLTARAYDTSGNFTTSSSVAVTVSNTIGGGADTVPPTVSITSPTAGTTVSGSVIITSSAGDASGVAQVKFYRGTTLIGSDTCGTGPTCNATGTYNFAVTWNTTGLSGAQSLTAVAYDMSGNVTTSAPVSVTVGTIVTGGSFTTWNPNDISSRVTLSNNNLTAARNGGIGIVRAAVGKSSGKWYWEVKLDTAADQFVGVANAAASRSAVLGSNRYGWSMVTDDGVKFNRGNQGTYGTMGSNGDVIGVALDMDNKKINFYKKNSGSTTCTNFGTAFTNLNGTVYPAWGSQFLPAQGTVNFGASPFACPVPAGFTAGVTQ